MKYLLLLALALTGCATAEPPSPVQAPAVPTQAAIGFDRGGDIAYTCVQSEVNQALVWDICTFHSWSPRVANMCITVSYNKGFLPVATSRMICSGPLNSHNDQQGYAAFTPHHGREELQQFCGSDLTQCKLTVEEVKQ